MKQAHISRRGFLKVASAAGLVIGFDFPARAAQTQSAAFTPNAFLKIDDKGVVTLQLPKSEMGQGTYTAIVMMVAEELEVSPKDIVVEIPDASGKKFAPVSQSTGGSDAVRTTWEPMRTAGAVVRSMLIDAAAQDWKVDASTLHAEDGKVIHDASGKSAAYGSLVGAAAKLKAPEKVNLKDPSKFKIIGKPTLRLDAAGKVNGSTVYGIDVRFDGLKIASLAQSPVIGGKVKDLNEAAALKIEGVVKVVNLGDAVAVVADDMWTAKQGLAALNVTWDEGENAKLSQADIVNQLLAAGEKEGAVAGETGKVADVMGKPGAKIISATYQQPFLAHAPMEPSNCTAHVTADRCEIWVGTQDPGETRARAAAGSGLPPASVTVHNYLVGGGFGRRLEGDMAERAAQISKAAGMPVKVVWSREEDIQHDLYRPYYYDKISAAVDESGKPVAWSHRIVGSSIMARLYPKGFKGVDEDAVDGAVSTPYDIPNTRVEYVRQDSPVITSWWRGVGPLRSIFVVESFIDELAAAAKIDPVAYRLSLIKDARAKAVLQKAAEMSDWGNPVQGLHRGIALLNAWDTYLAEVVELELKNGTPIVKRVVAVVDCGQVVNPSGVEAQLMGGVIFGLTAGLFSEITINNGRVQQSNFHDYRMIRMDNCPKIETYIMPSNEKPGGMGEPPCAGLMPALANAMFAATGRRIRKLPVLSSVTT